MGATIERGIKARSDAPLWAHGQPIIGQLALNANGRSAAALRACCMHFLCILCAFSMQFVCIVLALNWPQFCANRASAN